MGAETDTKNWRSRAATTLTIDALGGLLMVVGAIILALGFSRTYYDNLSSVAAVLLRGIAGSGLMIAGAILITGDRIVKILVKETAE